DLVNFAFHIESITNDHLVTKDYITKLCRDTGFLNCRLCKGTTTENLIRFCAVLQEANTAGRSLAKNKCGMEFTDVNKRRSAISVK
ncbi:hypothetical protein KC963_01385, partial [Candidatus Saccharibacteria bacterium]|nr:hypothetical protein [Candidatus Saccharibacteria bacterium]